MTQKTPKFSNFCIDQHCNSATLNAPLWKLIWTCIFSADSQTFDLLHHEKNVWYNDVEVLVGSPNFIRKAFEVIESFDPWSGRYLELFNSCAAEDDLFPYSIRQRLPCNESETFRGFVSDPLFKKPNIFGHTETF